MKILLVGDTHCNAHWVLLHVARIIEESDPDVIVQLGDFCLSARPEFLEAVSDVAAGRDWFWIDGNHDPHPQLNQSANKPKRIWADHGRIYHLPRGHSWEWDGVRFLACGGGISIDKGYRTPGRDWWPEEAISDADVDRCAEAGTVDVLLTHDAPQVDDGVLETYLRQETHRIREKYGDMAVSSSYKMDRASEQNRRQVGRILDACEAGFVFHGHYHHNYVDTITHHDGSLCTIRGLNRDERGGALFMLDTKE